MQWSKNRYSGFFSGVIFGRSCRSEFLEFSANFDVEDWKMTLEELRLGYSNLWDQTWKFSSVEVSKLANCSIVIVPFPYFPLFLLTTSLAASCFSQQIHVDIPREEVGMTWKQPVLHWALTEFFRFLEFSLGILFVVQVIPSRCPGFFGPCPCTKSI